MNINNEIQILKSLRGNKEEFTKYLEKFNNEDLKQIRIEYAKQADTDTKMVLAQAGYTVESYIEYINTNF